MIAGGICDFLGVPLKLPVPVVTQPVVLAAPILEKGMKVRVKAGAKDLNAGKELAKFVYTTAFDLQSLNKKTGRAVIGLNGKVTASVNVKDLYKM